MLSHKILVTTQLILFPVLVNKHEIEFQKKSAMNYFDEKCSDNVQFWDNLCSILYNLPPNLKISNQ